MKIYIITILIVASLTLMPTYLTAKDSLLINKSPVSDLAVKHQNALLDKNTKGKGFGPQSPRDIDSTSGNNPIKFAAAPNYKEMNLCNIHFHKNAEHKGGEFTKYAGNGDGHGYLSGFKYSGTLSSNELKKSNGKMCPSKHGVVEAGDTIEVHYVHSSAQVKPGPTLAACLSDSMVNPQFRVETQVYVLVSDKSALDFNELTKHNLLDGRYQALNIPTNTGKATEYPGSTTGATYNEQGSPYQVTWSVRPKVAKVDIHSVGKWCKDNVFNEDHAHSVRNLVTNPELLSEF
jgi:carbonic anhydrase